MSFDLQGNEIEKHVLFWKKLQGNPQEFLGGNPVIYGTNQTRFRVQNLDPLTNYC